MKKGQNATVAPAAKPLITPGFDLIVESWGLFKQVWKKFLGLLIVIPLLSTLIWVVIMAIIFIVFIISSLAVGGPAAAALEATFTAQSVTSSLTSTVGEIFLADALGNVLFIVLGLIGVASLIILVIIPFAVGFYSTVFVLREPELKVWDAFKKGLKFFWRYFWVMILMSVVTLIGYILFVVPGIIFSIWFAFVMYVLLLEDIGSFKALGRSRELVKGFWWTVFARLLLIAIFSIIFSALLNMINSISGAVFELGSQSRQLPLILIGALLTFLTFFIALIVNYVVYSIITIYKYLLYERLKAIKQRDAAAVDGMSSGKKVALSLCIIIPFILIVLIACLFFMVGVGSYIESELGTSTVNIDYNRPYGGDAISGEDFIGSTSTMDDVIFDDPLNQ